MKKIFALLVLLCLCVGTAQAEKMYPADKDRIVPMLPPGMAATCTASNGKLDILIDLYKTDWDMVATAVRKSGSLAIYPGIAKPAGAEGYTAQSDYYRYEGMTVEQSEQRVLDSLINWSGDGTWLRGTSPACSEQGWAIGYYDEGSGLFVPMKQNADGVSGISARWKMKDGTFRSERVRLTIRFSEYEPVYTRRREVRADHVAANISYNEWSTDAADVCSIEKKDGRLTYHLNGSAIGKEVYTAISAPSWLKVKEGWKAYKLGGGAPQELKIQPAGSFGLKNSSVVLNRRISRENAMNKHDWAIQWVDENGATQAVFYLEALFTVNDPKFRVSYEPDVQPLPASALKLETRNLVSAFSVTYNEKTGELSKVIDEDKIPSNGKTDLSLTTVSAKITAPAGAASCKVTRFRGDIIYGDSGSGWEMGVIPVKAGQAVSIPELTDMIYLRKIPVTLHNGKHMEFYFSPMGVSRYGGESFMMEWLDAKGKRIGMKQQVTVTTNAYDIVTRRSPSLTKNPNALVNGPVVQMERDGMYVVWAELPQLGKNIRRYDISLENKDGNKVVPDSSVILYLPYPEGKSMQECENEAFVVYHQLSDGSYAEYSTQMGNLKMTPYGLCMEVSSFSPYYLAWEDSSAAEGLPQTGDHSLPIAFLMMMMITSVWGLGVLVKRKYN